MKIGGKRIKTGVRAQIDKSLKEIDMQFYGRLFDRVLVEAHRNPERGWLFFFVMGFILGAVFI